MPEENGHDQDTSAILKSYHIKAFAVKVNFLH